MIRRRRTMADETRVATWEIVGAMLRYPDSAVIEALPADASAQAESVAVMNRAMESLIRQCPQQYLWGYHRYKAPRAGAAD